MPAKILDDDVMHRLIKQGHGPAEIVRRLAASGVTTTSAAVCLWKKRNGVESNPVRYADLIPWTLAPEHRRLYAVKMLRAEARRRTGAPLKRYQEEQLDRWLDRLKEEDRVVHYDPETDQGFWYVPRRVGIDTDIIRDPSVEDD